MKFTLSVRSFHVPARPRTCRLSAQFSIRADFAGDASHFRMRTNTQLIDHRIDGVLQLEDFTFDVDRDLFGEVAVGDLAVVTAA